MSFHRTTHVKKTRRDRVCHWCNETIKKGEPSVTSAGVFEGDFYRGRYHPECDAAIDRWCETNKEYELPDETMNRGGIQPRGENESPC